MNADERAICGTKGTNHEMETRRGKGRKQIRKSIMIYIYENVTNNPIFSNLSAREVDQVDLLTSQSLKAYTPGSEKKTLSQNEGKEW